MKTIFFDLDDTLYFRRDAFLLAFDDFFKGQYSNLSVSADERCRIRGDEIFYSSQGKNIPIEETYIYRFQTGFKDVGIEISEAQALEFYSLYKKSIYNMKLNPAVISMLDFAKSSFERLGIMTNGESAHQRKKIQNLGLEKWIDTKLIVISGEYGCPKPDKRLFETAQEKAGCARENLVIVGDSFQNDILPAHELGWHTIWINLYGEKFKSPEFEVKNVSEIPTIFQKLSSR